MPQKDPAVLKKVTVSLPFGLGSAEWETDPAERRAAWSLYVELVTRVSVQPLGLDEGLMREALSSLHSLFETTRKILSEAGPDVGAAKNSVGGIAIEVLNRGLRPFLAMWHPLLLAWESQRPPEESPRDHERTWPEEPKLRGELESLREELLEYSRALAVVAGVER